MMNKYLISAFLLISVFIIHESNCSESNGHKSLLDIIINTAKSQIKKLLDIVENIIAKALEEINEIQMKIGQITEDAINLAVTAINIVIDGAIDSVRKIAEDAIDAGINITECYVNSVDELNILRRELITKEVLCATNQLNQFNNIINDAVKNFTDDLSMIAGLPKRLQDCLTSLNAIQCVTKIVTDVVQLQQDIPQQIIGTMLEISDYMTRFEQRVHKCQFGELRNATEESRKIIDQVKYCAREAKTVPLLSQVLV